MKAKLTLSKFGMSILGVLLLSCYETWARPPRASEACGTIVKINQETKFLILSCEQGSMPLNLKVTRNTKFIHNWQFTDVTTLEEGLRACVYYRSPFFGKPFATKVVWTKLEIQKASQKGTL